VVLYKKNFFEKNNKNEAIWGIVFQFLTVPVFFGAFALTGGAMFGGMLWTSFFVAPILHKLLFGSWS
jgi:hypothetical protein